MSDDSKTKIQVPNDDRDDDVEEPKYAPHASYNERGQLRYEIMDYNDAFSYADDPLNWDGDQLIGFRD